MKKLIAIVAVLACVTVSIFATGATTAYADTTTVTGTVDASSHDDILKLNCAEGTMELKIDSATDFTGCKSILPGQKLSINITYGNDGYWHVASFKDGVSTIGATVDTSNVSTVTGKIVGVVSDNVLKLQLSNGEMHVKLDPTTDYSAVSYIMVGKTYSVRVAYGSDAYMHAVSFADSNANIGGSSTGTSYITPATTVAATTTVSGKVGSKSNSSFLYLECSDGEMQIKLDALNKAYVLYHGQQISVGIGYDGGYWHAVTIKE